MSRRSAGDGSVYETPDGSGWMYSINVPASGGKKRRRIRGRARTKTEALEKLRKVKRELEENGEGLDRRRLVHQSVESYAKVRAAEELEQGTRDQDRRLGTLIVAGLGSQQVDKLSADDCDNFLEAVAAGHFGDPMGRGQLRRLRRYLYRVIENDRRRGLVGRNVADLTVLPPVSKTRTEQRQRRALPLDELRRALDHADGVIELLIDLSGRNGLRPAEARGLRWSRVDMAERTIRVDAQINRRNEVVKAKTKRSTRVIRFDEATSERLERWALTQADLRDRAAELWTDSQGLVATTSRGTPINQRNVHRSLAVLSQRAGISPAISGYDLRYTAITHQVERRVPPHKIADWAGTSERMIWEVYRQMLEEVSDVAPIDLDIESTDEEQP